MNPSKLLAREKKELLSVYVARCSLVKRHRPRYDCRTPYSYNSLDGLAYSLTTHWLAAMHGPS